MSLQRFRVLGAVAVLLSIVPYAWGQAQKNDNGAAAKSDAARKNMLIDVVSMIQIDAVITGKDGKFIQGLSPENFALEEEGRPQRLTGVDHFVAGGVGDGHKLEDLIDIDLEPRGGLGAGLNPVKVRPVVINRRMIVLFFDTTTMTNEDLRRSVDASRKFVKEQMAAADLVAVISFGEQFKIRCGLTNDREVVERALGSLIPGKNMASTLPGSPNDMVETEDDGRQSAEEIWFPFTIDSKLYAIEALADLLEPIPGRKSVVEFTSAISHVRHANPAAQPSATNIANKNVVSLYEVDLNDSVAPDDGKPVAGDSGEVARIAAAEEWRKVAASLAHDTGGKLFADVKDFAPIFKQVQDDSQDYYLLSYYSTNTKRDGLFRNVSVKLEKVRGAQIKFRPGYYGPMDVGLTKPPQH
jgi:VWFA-related protein